MEKQINPYIIPFISWFTICAILMWIFIFYYINNFSNSNRDESILVNNEIVEELNSDGTEENTEILWKYEIDSILKNDICNQESLSTIDDLNQSQYEEFLIHSLKSNPGGNDIFYLVRKYWECIELYENGIISNDRSSDCKIKNTLQSFLNGNVPNADILSEIRAMVEGSDIVVDDVVNSITTKQCDSLNTISNSVVEYCRDIETFNTFKQALFKENLAILCQ